MSRTVQTSRKHSAAGARKKLDAAPQYTVDQTWPTRAQVASALGGCSEKTVDRYVTKGLIERRYRRVLGKRSNAVYNPADVEKLVQASAAVTPFVMPPAVGVGTAVAKRSTSLALVEPDGPSLPYSVVAAGHLRHKLTLTIKEAAAFSGFTQVQIRKLIDQGTLKSIRDVSVKVGRRGLENLVAAMLD